MTLPQMIPTHEICPNSDIFFITFISLEYIKFEFRNLFPLSESMHKTIAKENSELSDDNLSLLRRQMSSTFPSLLSLHSVSPSD